MDTGPIGFVPQRLVEARSARRIRSKKQLAELIDVSPSTITRWEKGEMAPDYDTLSKLADILSVRREFFLRAEAVPHGPKLFRALASATKADLAYQSVNMQWLLEIGEAVQHYVDLPDLDIPDVLDGGEHTSLSDEDIERIAGELRDHWNLGLRPIGDAVSLLERVGCVVANIDMGNTKIDGLCRWSATDRRPHILLVNDKMSFFRRQLDAMHELGHAVLHRNISEEELTKEDVDLAERQAYRFAGALLLPSKAYPLDVNRYSLAELLSLKEKWKVSVKAQIKRLSDLDVIPQHHATNLYKLYSAKGWNSGEPMDDEVALQRPTLLKESLQLITDANVRSRSELLSVEFAFSAGDVERIVGLPAGWFDEDFGQVVRLKKSNRSHSGEKSRDAKVIPFPGS